MSTLLRDILLPRTDAALAVQAGIVLVILAMALWRTLPNPDLRIFALGVGVFLLSLMTIEGNAPHGRSGLPHPLKGVLR